jgi:hypothetical protein
VGCLLRGCPADKYVRWLSWWSALPRPALCLCTFYHILISAFSYPYSIVACVWAPALVQCVYFIHQSIFISVKKHSTDSSAHFFAHTHLHCELRLGACPPPSAYISLISVFLGCGVGGGDPWDSRQFSGATSGESGFVWCGLLTAGLSC